MTMRVIVLAVALVFSFLPSQAQAIKCWRCIPCHFDASAWNDLSFQHPLCYLQQKHDIAPAYMNPEVGPLVYASKVIQSSIVVYEQTGPGLYPVAKLSDQIHGPQGLFVDRHGDLYVANTIDQNILVFHRGALHAYRVLNDFNSWPVSVAVDTDGTVYVANIHVGANGPGSVSIYARGATEKIRTLTLPNFKVMSLALDAQHNLYVSYLNLAPGTNRQDPLYTPGFRGGRIAEFAHGFAPARAATPLTWVTPGGMQFDAQGRIIIAEQGKMNLPYSGMSIYDLASDTRLSTFGFDEYSSMAEALSADQHTIWAIDSIFGTLNEYTYPGGARLRTIGSNAYDELGVWIGDPPYGVAVDPAPSP